MRVPVSFVRRWRHRARAIVLVGGLAGAGLAGCGRSSRGPVIAPDDPTGARSPNVDNGDGIAVAGWTAGAVRVPSTAEAWGGPRTGNEPTLSERVASYELRAVVDPVKHTVEGTEKLHWKNRSDRAVRTLYFHTYLNGFEGPGSTWMTEKARFGQFRTGVDLESGQWGHIDVASITQGGQAATMRYIQPDGGPTTDRSVLRVDLPEAVAAGAEVTLDIKFHDQLPRVTARTGYFGSYHLIAQWFPKIGVLELAGERGADGPRWNCHEFHMHTEFYADWGSYDLEIVAPKGFTVGAVGGRVGAPRDTPEGTVHHFHQDDVHDVAFTMWDGFAPPLRGGYDGPGSPHVDVQVLYPPEWESSGRAALQGTIDALGYFSRTLGPYPYKQVTVVVPPYNADESGGMEYETFFTSIGGSDTVDALVRYVTVHEFGHGYFMGLLASNEFEEPFLDEGINEWWDSRMLESEQLRFDLGLLGRLGFGIPPLHIWDFQWASGSSPAGRPLADPIAGNSWHRMSSATYGAVYAHTAIVMHDLEKRLGGDAIARGMKLYYARWHHRHPSAADLRDALADAAPEHAEAIRAWFEQQVYAADLVDDTVDEVSSEELLPQPGRVAKDGKIVERTADDVAREIADRRDAAGSAPPFPFRTVVRAQRHAAQVPQTLVVTFSDGSEVKLAWPVGERWHRWVFDKPVRGAEARLDPAGDILLDADKLDDGRTRVAHSLPAVRLASDGTTWFETFLSLVSSL